MNLLTRRIRKWLCMALALICCCGVLGTTNAAYATYRFDFGSWMKYLPDDMQISQINMPGTHDAGTVYMDFYAQKSGSCQNFTIMEQLEHGHRVLDIRLRYNPMMAGLYKTPLDLELCHGDFGCYHDSSKYDSLKLGHVIDWAKSYLSKHTSETVILVLAEESQKDATRPKIQEFMDEHHHSKNDFVLTYNPGEDVPTLGEVRGHCVVIWDGKVRPYTKYEMEYECYRTKEPGRADIICTPQNKRDRLEALINDASVKYKWELKYFGETHDAFNSTDFYNVKKPGNPATPKYIGTNLTNVSDAKDAIIETVFGDGPKNIANLLYLIWRHSFIDTWPIGYRYGWITMDDALMPAVVSGGDATLDLRQYIIKTNYAMPAYQYNIQFTNVPKDIDLSQAKISISNAHETLQGNKGVVHPVKTTLRDTDIGATITIKYAGKTYTGTLKNRQFSAHDPMADYDSGLWGTINATYEVKSYKAPKTGDSAHPVLWSVLLMLAVSGLTVLGVRRKKYH